MQRQTTIWTLAASFLILLACGGGSPEYPWIYDLDAEVDAQGKMVGYEFWAKW